ncbi:MAG: hypothetical protein ACRDRA_05970 [Pseudonocardiaceae bacterium]
MSGPRRWVLSPLDCQAHMLLPEGDHPVSGQPTPDTPVEQLEEAR